MLKAGIAGFAAALAIVVGLPASAGAASQLYHPNEQSRAFTTTQGGWEFSSEQEDSVCIAPLTCPSAEGTYAATYGASGPKDGFLLTVLDGLTNVAVTTRTEWKSPAFTYNGIGGKTPDALVFSMAQQVRYGDLVGLVDPVVIQNVKLVIANSAERGIILIKGEELKEIDSWTAIEPIQVNPNQLTIGQDYQLVVEATFRTPVDTFPFYGVAYDNVQLRASSPPKAIDNAQESRLLSRKIKRNLGPASLSNNGKKVSIAVVCPDQAGPEGCDLRLKPRLNRGGKAIGVKAAKGISLNEGADGVVTFRIKKSLREKVADKKRIFVGFRGKAGGVRVKGGKRVPLKD